MKKVSRNNKRRERIELTVNLMGKTVNACLAGMGALCTVSYGAVAYEQMKEHDFKAIGNAAFCGLWAMFTMNRLERLGKY